MFSSTPPRKRKNESELSPGADLSVAFERLFKLQDVPKIDLEKKVSLRGIIEGEAFANNREQIWQLLTTVPANWRTKCDELKEIITSNVTGITRSYRKQQGFC